MRQALRALDQGHSPIRLHGRGEGVVPGVACQILGKIITALPVMVSAGATASPDLHMAGSGETASTRFAIALARLLKLDSRPGLLSSFHILKPDSGFPCEDDTGLDLARMTALLGTLASATLRQDVALVGGIGLQGQVLPVDNINERIESWFEFCRKTGLTGQQSIVIPRVNRIELMLKREVVKACTNDMFRVYAVDSVVQAAELCTGVRAGSFKSGAFADDSLLGRARSGLRA